MEGRFGHRYASCKGCQPQETSRLPSRRRRRRSIKQYVRIFFLLASAVAHLPLLFPVHFHLFLLEYFWQLSAFDHGRFRTVLLHLMTTGVRLCPSLFLFLFLFLFFISVPRHVGLFCRRIPFRAAPAISKKGGVLSERTKPHPLFSPSRCVVVCLQYYPCSVALCRRQREAITLLHRVFYRECFQR